MYEPLWTWAGPEEPPCTGCTPVSWPGSPALGETCCLYSIPYTPLVNQYKRMSSTTVDLLVIQTCAGTSAQLLHANSRVIMQSYNANSRVIMYWSDQDTRRELEKYTTKQPYRGLTQNTKRLCIDTTIFYTCAHAQLVERLPRKQSVYQSRIPPRADLLFSLERKSCPGCSWLVCYALPFYLIDTRFIHAQ